MRDNESNEGGQTCLFCGKPVPEAFLLPLCEKHGGTATVRFRGKWGDWYLFLMGYPSRLPDWLLVDPNTGEVRRFVEISENDVRAAIKGVTAGNQQDLTPFAESEEVLADATAGKGPRLADYIPDSVPVYVPANPADLMLASLTFGSLQDVSLTFADRPSDYPKSGRTEERLIEVRERIMRREYEMYEKRKAEGVTSEQWNWVSFLPDPNADPKQAGTTPSYPPLPTQALELAYSYELVREPDSWPDVLDDFSSASPLDYFARTLFSGLSEEVRKQVPEWECQTLCMQVHSVLWSLAPDLVDDFAKSPTQAIQRNIIIAGREFKGVLLCWAHTSPLCAFKLDYPENENVTYHINGSAFGITLTDLQDVLQELVLLNHNDELLAHYQAQLDAEFERLRSFYGQ